MSQLSLDLNVMRAAVLGGDGSVPQCATFPTPIAAADDVSLSVIASSLHHLTRSRASGAHYSLKNDGSDSSSNQLTGVIPGVDGVGCAADGTRFYFAMPKAPWGSMAERVTVPKAQCVELPAGLDPFIAAALAIPCMSAHAALSQRAKLQVGETVLINGATGISGLLAVQVAKRMGAGFVIATGRNVASLDEAKKLGADEVIQLEDDSVALNTKLRQSLQARGGVDVVLDYLWGTPAEELITVLAHIKTSRSMRYVEVGSMASPTISLPAHALRATNLQIMGSGMGSLSLRHMLESIKWSLQTAAESPLSININIVPLSAVAAHWNEKGTDRRRIVFKIDA